MGPDPKQRRAGKNRAGTGLPPSLKTTPSSDDEHVIVYFRRYASDDPARPSPGRAFLNSCPPGVRAKMRAILIAVATAPPKKFSGGGYWEAMHGVMAGWFEIRVDGPSRKHYRLFCQLDYDAKEMAKPLLVVIDGRCKPFRTTLAENDYTKIRAYGDEYRTHNPRSIV